MAQDFLKSAALWSVSKGLTLPQVPIERLNELSSLKALLTDLKVDCVLDVGANRGQFAHELRGIGYEGLIVSFEPVQSEFQALQARFSNDLKWRGFQFALGNSEQMLSITVPRLTVLSSLLESRVHENGAREETVQVKRLDEVWPALNKEFAPASVFLKMDTQGFDLRVFEGASACLSSIRGLQSELSIQPLYKGMPHYLEALAVYEAAGFLLHNLSVVSRADDGGLVELNCFMRRAQFAA